MTTSVRIDKFWVGALLGDAYPHFSADKGADLDGNGTIEGKEVFKDFNGDGEVGDREDYKQYLSQNRAALSAKVPFFKWGEKLGVGNRIHQELYFESDLKEAPLLQSAYVFISDLVEKVNAMAEGQNLTPEQESGLYYEEMEKSGIKFRNQKSASLVGNIQNRTLDCDTSSFVAMALGDERGLILKLVRVPNHVFLQGRGKRGPFNMDQGVIEPNIIYEREFDLDSERAKRGDYLSPLEDQKMESLFLASRGCELTELERYREALAAYDRAIELDSQSAFAHTNRGIVLDKLGRYREALAAYDRAIELDSRDANPHDNRGAVLGKLGRYREALAAHDRAIELDSYSAFAHTNRGVVLDTLGRYREALAAYDRAIELDSRDARFHDNRGVVLGKLGRYREALAAHDRAIELDSYSAFAHTNRGVVLNQLERYQEALEAYDRAIELDSRDANFHYNRGIVLVKLGRDREALSAFDRAVELNPEDGLFRFHAIELRIFLNIPILGLPLKKLFF